MGLDKSASLADTGPNAYPRPIASDRYTGKPFLKLLDSYVLWAIGHLDTDATERLAQMTPYLARTYAMSGEWHEIVAAQMRLPDDMKQKIASLWTRNLEIARQRQEALDPLWFPGRSWTRTS